MTTCGSFADNKTGLITSCFTYPVEFEKLVEVDEISP